MSPRDNLDDLEERWVGPERDTAKQIKRIESSGPPESFPPPSTDTLIRNIRAWLKANAWLFALLGIGSTTGMVTPWRDWLGLATVAALQAEAKRNDDARKAQDATTARELKRARDAAGRAAQRVDDLESQLVAQKVLVESLGGKRRR